VIFGWKIFDISVKNFKFTFFLSAKKRRQIKFTPGNLVDESMLAFKNITGTDLPQLVVPLFKLEFPPSRAV
jgi:hypothetical protein